MRLFCYQNRKSKNYFEGWYFRFTTDNKNYAVIIAITKNEEDPHSFLQIFDDSMRECLYVRYENFKFHYNFDNKTLSIGENHISPREILIDEEGFNMNLRIQSFVKLRDLGKIESAMGYMSKLPLECFQEVVFLDGEARGTINDEEVRGRIYLEKTYGSKFPVQWIWLQSNHSVNGSQISFSVGKIPFLGVLAKGFLCALNTGNEVYHFYTGNLSKLDVYQDRLIIKKGKHKLIITPEKAKTIKLVGPAKKAEMSLEVYESLTAKAHVKLYENDTVIFEDDYTNVGYENMW